MSEESLGNQFTINYQHVHKALTFSHLSQFAVPDEAFEVFVQEMTDAFEVMRELRQISETAVSKAQKAEVFELLYQVVTVTQAGYRPNARYTIECVQARDAALKNLNIEHTPDVIIKIAMAEYLGPSVYSLRSIISSLLGHMKLIKECFPSNDERQEYFVTIDKIIAHILKILELHKSLLSSGISLQDLEPTDIQMLFD